MNGLALLKEAQNKRENSEFVEALNLLTDALLAFQEEKNLEKIVETLAEKSLVLRHIGSANDGDTAIIFAKHTAMAAVEIAKKNNINPTIPLYNLAKDQESLNETSEAIGSIKEALNTATKPSLIAEMKTRLASLEYKNGDDAAEERFRESLEELKKNPHEDEYTQKVWLSGAYMHMAESMIGKNDERAKEFLLTAKDIITSDPALKIRKRQIETLEAKFV